MVEPVLSLAFSVHSSPGVYALLVGSGVSRSAGIPTGWEVTLDLIRRLAALEGEDPGSNPEEWYRDRSNSEPDYSKLLGSLGRSRDDRSRILRRYFEPTAEEREQGLKTPQAGHRAIADLVRAGLVRVILTTNFDRLLEQALQDVGVAPTVISTPDAATGATPLAHSACTLVKVNGDYLDTRVKNTQAELAEYDPRVDRLLDQILDEYGLVVCGWSADWDVALRAAVERCPSRRFSTYWAARSEPAGRATQLIRLRDATTIMIDSADQFFTELVEKVTSLAEFDRPHPLSTASAVATMKRYLPEDRHRIRRADLLSEEVARVASLLTRERFPPGSNTVPYTPDAFVHRVKEYEALTETLRALVATVGRWGRIHDAPMVGSAIQRLASTAGVRNGLKVWLDLELYPALLAWYSVGVNALAAERYDLLKALLGTRIRFSNEETTVAAGLTLASLPQGSVWDAFFDNDRHCTAASEHLASVLHQLIPDSAPTVPDKAALFDRFEYMLALEFAERTFGDEPAAGSVPYGRFIWRSRSGGGADVITRLHEEVAADAHQWPPIQAGLFGGAYPRFEAIESAVTRWIADVRPRIGIW